MTEFLMSIDTEASGLPKDWDLPYSAESNWPHCVQIAWIVYAHDGRELKRENHFVGDDDFTIAKSALKIHGITRQFLNEHGEPRTEILQKLADDVAQYKPLVVGHFTEFDLHMLNADFHRVGRGNPIKKEGTFCTMLATTNMVENPSLKFFRLGELYTVLFQQELQGQHNALHDAEATGACFFELVRRGEVTDATIAAQQAMVKTRKAPVDMKGCALLMIAFIIINCLIYFIYG